MADFDSSELKTFAYGPKPGYGLQQYVEVLQQVTSLEDPLPLVIANFDNGSVGRPLEEQIEAARALFDRFPGHLTNFILKPWTKGGSVVELSDLSDTDFANLRGFDIIGVTEKELGRDLLRRLRRIARLRNGLDRTKNSAPIHIWGGLDPVMTPLYFFAGAEIFDGVSWLRYAFMNGVAINRECHSVLSDLGVGTSRTENDGLASAHNLRYLDNLTVNLQQWVDYETLDFSMFHPEVAEYLKRSYKAMVASIDVLRESK